jgi:hypothetical protein
MFNKKKKLLKKSDSVKPKKLYFCFFKKIWKQDIFSSREVLRLR